MLHRLGLFAVCRFLHRFRLLVLVFHDIVPDDQMRRHPVFGMTLPLSRFEEIVGFVCRRYSPVSLDEVLAWHAKGTTLPRNPVLFTFDDGRRNLLTYAAPVLRKHRVPAVAFITSAYLDAGPTPLAIENAYLTIADDLECGTLEVGGEALPIEDERSRSEACGALFDHARRSLVDLEATIEQVLGNRLEARARGEYGDRLEFLRTEDLKALVQFDIRVESHGRTHTLLATASEDASKREIEQSRVEIETVLGRRVTAFAYPFGEPGLDFREREERLVEDAGYVLAFAGSGGLASRRSSTFAFPRIGIAGDTLAEVNARISGFRHIVSTWLGF